MGPSRPLYEFQSTVGRGAPQQLAPQAPRGSPLVASFRDRQRSRARQPGTPELPVVTGGSNDLCCAFCGFSSHSQWMCLNSIPRPGPDFGFGGFGTPRITSKRRLYRRHLCVSVLFGPGRTLSARGIPLLNMVARPPSPLTRYSHGSFFWHP